MTPSADNLRVKRTKFLLREALISLIEEQGFETITVGALTERAMVSRAAFYRNYQDKYDLVEQIFEEALGRLFEAINELGQEHPAEVWVRFFEHIAQYDRLYRVLLGKIGSCGIQMTSAWDLPGHRKKRRKSNTISKHSCKSNSSLNCLRRKR